MKTVMKMKRPLARLSPLAAALAVASLLAAAGGVPGAPAPSASPALAGAGLDLLGTLSALRSGPALRVERAANRLTLVDATTGDLVLVATPDGLAQVGGASAQPVQRPAPGEPARTRVVRDRAGAVVYTVSATARGGRMLVVEPGALRASASSAAAPAPGFTFVVFDNDDYSITARTPAAGPSGQAETRLVASRHTAYDGTLTVREGAAYGCGCERLVAPDGRVTARPL